jgi:hypothetical protein
MNVKHELTIYGKCPVDESMDRYEITIETNRIVMVEDILNAAQDLPSPVFQEIATMFLAQRLGCRVTTVGYHSGVKTTCSA